MNFEDKFEAARKNVDGRIRFYKHFASFAGVNSLLAAVDVLTSPGILWFFWPLGLWGLAVGIHGGAVTRGHRRGR